MIIYIYIYIHPLIQFHDRVNNPSNIFKTIVTKTLNQFLKYIILNTQAQVSGSLKQIESLFGLTFFLFLR